MVSLFFICPNTNQRASAGIETDPDSLRACWRSTIEVKCPHCGQEHRIPVCEAYVGDALQHPRTHVG